MSTGTEHHGHVPPSQEQLEAEVRAIEANPVLMNNLPQDLPFGATSQFMELLLERSVGAEHDTALTTKLQSHLQRVIEKTELISASIQAHGISIDEIKALQERRGQMQANPDDAMRAMRELVKLSLPIYCDLRAHYSYADLAGVGEPPAIAS